MTHLYAANEQEPTTVPIPSGQRFRILKLLARYGELTPAEMMERDEALPEGTPYTTARRLEKEGFLKARHVHDPRVSGPPRKLYSLSPLGQRALELALLSEKMFAPRRSKATVGG